MEIRAEAEISKGVASMQDPPLISQHISWISVDPIQGCPASCSYCYLQPKELNRKPPTIIERNPKIIYQILRNYRFFNKSIFTHAPQIWPSPIAIGNYTDMCLTTKNRDYLLEILRQHKQELPEIPVCILTKAALDKRFLEKISQINALVIFLISISFLPARFEQGTPPTKVRLDNFRILSEFPNLKAIHWWRPITSISIPNHKVVEEQIEILQHAGAAASVIISLRYGEQLKKVFMNTENPLNPYFMSKANPQNDSISEPWIQEEILKIAGKRAYPVFTGTSCAISYILERPCYKAGFRKPYFDQSCIFSSSPESQKDSCIKFAQEHPVPSVKLLNEIANYLDLSFERVQYSPNEDAIIVNGKLLQEEQNFLTQATSFPIIGDTLVKNLEWTANKITAPFTTNNKLKY